MMPVDWNAHRFSGGPLALCAANTVIYRADASRRADRLADPAEIPRFAAAAEVHCSDEFPGQGFSRAAQEPVLAVREAIDALFRSAAMAGGHGGKWALGRLLELAGRICGTGAADDAGLLPLDAALVHSALGLAYSGRIGRVRICGNCGWLFEDVSRNGSRLWCDMAVCGNRAKARRHYRKRSGECHAEE